VAVQNGVPDSVLGELYPFEDKYVEMPDGHQMHYIEMGRAGLTKPTFLLLHGNPTWSFLYRRFLPALASAGRVIAVDHVGFGRSDHPSDPAYHSLERHIQNLEAFAERTRIKRVVPVVQDWGGPIGLGYATRHQDRIVGLVLMNTWAFTEREKVKLPVLFRALRAPGIGEYALTKRNLFVEGFLKRLILGPVDELIMDAYRHPFPNPKSRAGILTMPRMIPTSPEHKEWATMSAIEKRLPELDVPAKILWGLKDPAFHPRFARAFHAILPRAEYPVFYDEAGHYLQEDIPGPLCHEIRDLARHI
jgi:cis-3-alkyl-4-acyloxetan-2-one decarboxylase